MRSELTISLEVARDPVTFVYVTRFGSVPYFLENWGGQSFEFWLTPWIETFWKTLESERLIKVIW